MEEIEYISPSKCVIKKVNDPYIYLKVEQEWFCYDPAQAPIGGGAMGTVYLGYRVSNGAQVAVKRVKDYYANQPQIRERARMEASLSFRHGNLIEILGFCQWDEGSGPFFILSNYVPGTGIKEFLRDIPYGGDRPQRIVRMLLPMLDALDYIHARGIVHRDIKPSNIMVEQGNNVRLMDLGIARMTGGNKFSSFGFIGTPQYAAPEQILRGEVGEIFKGIGKEINASTDIYATGITIYELITGNNPYDVPVDDEVLARQIKVDLPAHKGIPSSLLKVLKKATKKDQTQRYQTVKEFKQDLENYLNSKDTGSSVTAATGSGAIEWVKNNSRILAIASAIVLVIVLVLILIR